jgi:hypothetical protein
MATVASTPCAVHEKIAKGPGALGTFVFAGVAITAAIYIGWNLYGYACKLAPPFPTSRPPWLYSWHRLRVCERLS